MFFFSGKIRITKVPKLEEKTALELGLIISLFKKNKDLG